jgi:selenocysteine lyase/cysteine desulfurase
MYDIEQLRREEFPHSAELVYLNHAGISPLPQRTARKVQWVVEQLSGDPSRFFMQEGMPAMLELHNAAARHINAASPAELVPITSTVGALNAVAQAVDWRPGDNVIFCDLEFPSNAFPWLSLERDGVAARCATAEDGTLSVASLDDHTDGRTRLVAVSAVQFFSGARADLAALGRFCRERGILFAVDAIQAIGHMSIDVQAMNIDVLATGGMKSLLALPGVGFMYVRDAVAEQLRPRAIGSNATVNYMHWLAYDLTLQPGAARFGAGTPNVPGLFAVLSSLELLQELDVAAIDAHTSGLSRRAADLLAQHGLTVITPPEAIGPIVTFRSPLSSEETDRLVMALAERNVVVAKHLDAAGAPYIRLSFHCYNTPEEIDRFVEVYREAASG